MTEKRFYTDGKYVMQKGETWVVADGEHSADVIATALNELIEERNELQFDYNMEVLARQSVEKENEELKKENKELRQDNDIKFWKLQCMHYFNSNSLFMSEISRAMRKGYKVSDKFQEYLNELKEDSKEIKEKNERLFGDSDG